MFNSFINTSFDVHSTKLTRYNHLSNITRIVIILPIALVILISIILYTGYQKN